MKYDNRSICALTIAGSDSGGGAGIQADLKTFAAHGIHGVSAIAVLTAQNTSGVTAMYVPPVAFLRAQIDACFDDFRIGAVKVGMLATAEVIHAVADALEQYKPPAIVLDPVMVATSGTRLLAEDALDALRTRLLPLATLLTPNIPEAEVLLADVIPDANSADKALLQLRDLGASAVLLKGGHLKEGLAVIDRYDDGITSTTFEHERLAVDGHGTGCTLASAIAANLCDGQPLAMACSNASNYVYMALRNAYQPGSSNVVVLDHCWRSRVDAGSENKKAGD